MLDGQPFYFIGFDATWMPSNVAFNDTASVDVVLDAAQVGMIMQSGWYNTTMIVVITRCYRCKGSA